MPALGFGLYAHDRPIDISYNDTVVGSLPVAPELADQLPDQENFISLMQNFDTLRDQVQERIPEDRRVSLAGAGLGDYLLLSYLGRRIRDHKSKAPTELLQSLFTACVFRLAGGVEIWLAVEYIPKMAHTARLRQLRTPSGRLRFMDPLTRLGVGKAASQFFCKPCVCSCSS